MARSTARWMGLAVLTLVIGSGTGAAFGQRMLGSSNRKPAPKRVSAAKTRTVAATPRKTSAPAKAPARRKPRMQVLKVADPIAWQAALDRAGFSPGVIDGMLGPKASAAISAYQAFSGIPVTGNPDDATKTSLGIDTTPKTVKYTITAADMDLVAPAPKTWIEKSRVRLLGYPTLKHLIAERGHCSRFLASRMNPKMNLDKLKVGDTVEIPNVEPAAGARKAANIEIDLAHKIVRALDATGRVVGLFHCSIAKDRAKLPNGSCTIETIVANPTYTFDPKDWPEVKGVDQKLLIPSGPTNPVGLCWIGLSKPGYGIHGTPEPEMIGKSGSHGCFRLANWDAQRLSSMVSNGLPVTFKDAAAVATATNVEVKEQPIAILDPTRP